MPIEFNCPHCQHRLRTPDDKAGLSAKCPACGEAIWVPFPHETSSPAGGGEAGTGRSLPARDGAEEGPADRRAQRDHLPPEAPPGRDAEDEAVAGSTVRPCPECAADNPPEALQCEACGAPLQRRRRRPGGNLPTFEAGEVLSTSFRIYGQVFGWLLVAVLVAFCTYGLGTGLLVGVVVAVGLVTQEPVAAVAAGVLLLPVLLLIAAAASIGQARLFLNTARDQRVRLSDLFYALTDGRHLLLRGVAVSLIAGLILLLGFLMCILPGLVLALVIWPLMRVLVDEEPPGIEAISRTYQYVRADFLNVLLIGLLVLGINIGISMAVFCISLIPIIGPLIQIAVNLFAATYYELLYSVGYLRLTRQPTAVD